MLNEVQEFQDYTRQPSNVDTRAGNADYLGRFTLEAIMDYLGFERIFTILARGYLFRDGNDPYEQTDYARDALCAWCSIPDNKKNSEKEKWEFTTDFRYLHETFPELVDENGNGWYIRHIRGIIDFAERNPRMVKAAVRNKLPALRDGFERKWQQKVRQYQIPIFLESTEALWQIRFDDIIANALTLGALREMEAVVTEQQKEKLVPFISGDVKMEHLSVLISYYKANKPEDSDWVVLPAANFNCYFGSTIFSKKVLPAITDKIIQRSPMSHGSARYRVVEEYL